MSAEIELSPESILKFRTDRGWSQAQLANELGVSQPTVWRLEKGETFAKGPLKKVLEQMMSGDSPL